MDGKACVAIGGSAALAVAAVLAFSGTLTAIAAATLAGDSCKDLPSHSQLESALATARADENGGFDLDMWGTIVNRDGEVCAVARVGGRRRHRARRWCDRR